MSARVVATVGLDGRLVARKRSRDDADAVRLQHEAEVLAAARHPGVVELVDVEVDGEAVVLTTEFAGTHSLETLGPVGVQRAAGIIASLATTVADLHDLGIVHGRIEASHVVIGTGGRPMLCGFAGGGRLGTAPPSGPPLPTPGFCDPATSRDATLSPHSDVYGLGCLLRALVVPESCDVEPIPDRRWRLERIRPRWSGYRQRALLMLADRATDDVPSRRPPARRFAQDVLDTVPAAAFVDDEAREDDTPRERVRTKRLRVLGLVGALVIVGGLAVRGDRSTATPTVAASPTPTTSTTATAASPTSTSPTSPTSPSSPTSPTTIQTPTCSSAHGLVAPDLDGDGCGDPVHVEDDRIVVVGAQRFSAGQPGDRVAVGDWNCSGTASVAVLRPSTGAVFLFDTWATAGSDVSVHPIAVATDAVDLQTHTRGDGCTSLAVVHRDGTTEEVV